ncbi:uncharacterized protein [Chlorocebus sabaeus]|uniref:uncharacterized protein n=1 Tax=Chlorocebus sabaeus TaxID=60711 RepID=UPI0018B0CF9E|nr:uncharacterized protein LOC119621561 [Chlorocebus sabaeus]
MSTEFESHLGAVTVDRCHTGDREAASHVPWLPLLEVPRVVTPASVQLSLLFSLTPSQKTLLQGPPSSGDLTLSASPGRTPVFFPRSPQPCAGPGGGSTFQAEFACKVLGVPLPLPRMASRGPGLHADLSCAVSAAQALPASGGAHPSQEAGTSGRAPPRSISVLPAGSVGGMRRFPRAALVVDILMQSVINASFSSSHYWLLKGFFRLSKNSRLVRGQHLLPPTPPAARDRQGGAHLHSGAQPGKVPGRCGLLCRSCPGSVDSSPHLNHRWLLSWFWVTELQGSHGDTGHYGPHSTFTTWTLTREWDWGQECVLIDVRNLNPTCSQKGPIAMQLQPTYRD